MIQSKPMIRAVVSACSPFLAERLRLVPAPSALVVPCALAALLLASCADPGAVAGNSANTGNAQATGRIVAPSGAPAMGAWVSCRPDSLLPWESAQPGWSTRTDSAGRYLCRDLPPGPTAIEAREPASGLSVWAKVDLRADARITVPDDTLATPARIHVALPPGMVGTLVLTGLSQQIPVRGEETILISGVPAGWSGSVLLVADQRAVVESGLHVEAGSTDSAGYTRSSARIRVPLAGGLSAPVFDLPILVRLDSSWTGFGSTLPDGADIRLAAVDGRELPVTIAAWNPASRIGSIWTVLDTLEPPGDSIDLVLSWGIPVPPSDPAQAFAGARGWVAAWPLGDTAGEVLDLVGSLPGTPYAVAATEGVVGQASLFDGRASRIDIPGSRTGALDFAPGGPYTLTCWVRLADFGTSRHVAGQGENDYSIKFQKNWSLDDLWMAKDSRSAPNGGRYSLTAADTARWTHLAMVVADSTVRLFVDGMGSDSVSLWDPDVASKASGLFRIGAGEDSTGAPAQLFHGAIDEVWAQGRARSDEWIRIIAHNQAPAAARARILR